MLKTVTSPKTWLAQLRLTTASASDATETNTGPQIVPSTRLFPAGPQWSTLMEGSTDAVSWSRFRIWAADWYIDTLEQLINQFGDVDRYVGVELAIDGALSNLYSAFEATTSVLIDSVESHLVVPKAERIPDHRRGWPAFKKLLKTHDLADAAELADLIAKVDAAMEVDEDHNPIGWLAKVRQLRNHPAHHGTLARTWAHPDDGGGATITGADDVVTVLKAAADGLSSITEQLLRAANQYRWIGILGTYERRAYDGRST